MDIHQDQVKAGVPFIKGLGHPVQRFGAIGGMDNFQAGFFDYFTRKDGIDELIHIGGIDLKINRIHIRETFKKKA